MSTQRSFTMTLIALATLAGCTMQPPKNAQLDQARSDYQAAQDNTEARTLAGAEMKQAGDALSLANQAAERGDKSSEVDHLAYLARQRTAIARETGNRKAAEQAVNNAEGARDKVRLAARTAEADMAHQQLDGARAATSDALTRNQKLERELKALNAKQTPRGMVITIGDVLFATNSADLTSGGRHNLDKLAEFLKNYPEKKALIEGFTDSVGSDEHNLQLSVRRAGAVLNALVEKGIASERLSTLGFGEAYPVAGNGSSSGRQMNRRVEIILSDESGKISTR
ncbi:OmpA family protein [Zoogloea dura]|jgi:outer membrane protein OmpA-like peptidoglycan-associated protein|uniref:OmpA family protein n=1 Tax=Zoogloea dura TaxID=2728840 RepID=A0A848FZ71_9RHOO|nr:OmpA family protein [Zoogloea dura]NML24146.1 OmpA family protein [Zoogloea dura]